MNPAEQPVLEAIELCKSYGKRPAVRNLSLRMRSGEVTGLLGPNGAGKSTTLSILSTLLAPDSGRVLIGGMRPDSNPRGRGKMIGLVPQSLALYPMLSAAENVWHFARMHGLSRSEAKEAVARVLAEVGLADRASDAMHTFSGGMKRRLNFACGLVHRPAVLLLDEPTVGCDVQSREQILALVRRCAGAGCAVVFSTHYMEEAERVCDRILLIDRGTLIAEGSIEQLIASAGGRPRMELTYRGQLPPGWLGNLAGVREIDCTGGEGMLALEIISVAQVGEVLVQARASGLQVIDFSLHSPNLADAFASLTGHTLRDGTQEAG
jgi:ABC-2 type transport system ATP-binding protein